MAYDRRTRHAVDDVDLQWLTDVVWPGRPRGAGPPPPCSDPLRHGYRVLPGARTPWLVAPHLTRRAGLRGLASGRALLPRRALAIRALAASRLVLPTGRAAVVPVSEGAHGDEGFLVERLSTALGIRVRPLVVIGERDPNRKPTLQLLDDDGVTVGYAKVGWNLPTRAMVRREAAALQQLAARLPADGAVRVPDVLLALSLDDLGLEVLVTRPMPARARRVPVSEDPSGRLLGAIAAATAERGVTRVVDVAGLGMWDDHRRGLAAAAEQAPETVVLLRRVLDEAVARVPPEATVTVGGWHGDLAPWNLAHHRSGGRTQTWVWDWEHAAPDRPLGFDLLHHRFAVLRHVRRESTADSLSAVRDAAVADLTGLGAHPGAVAALVTGYAVERWLRAAELAASGAGWDEAIHPALAEALGRPVANL